MVLNPDEWRVLICGGREYGFDKDPVTKKLTVNFLETEKMYDIIEKLALAAKNAGKCLIIIHGAARGADTLADEAAKSFGIRCLSFPADWTTHKKAAGPIRNQQMLKEGKPHLVIAVPGGKGTAHMCKIATEANIPVRKIGF